MAVELEKFIGNQLASLPPDCPDREYLEGLLIATKSYIERAGCGVATFANAKQAVKEYRFQPHTPELVTRTYQTIWLEQGELVGMVFEVCPCPYTQEELADLEQQGKRVGYLPVELATQQSRHLLGKMFPQMRSDSVWESNPITNNENPSGWFDYETRIDAPYLNTNEDQLEEKVVEGGRMLLSLNQYIVAGQDSKLLTGQYLDEERTWARLGSRDEEGRVIGANFNQDGNLRVRWSFGSDHHTQRLGGRSSKPPASAKI